MLVGRKPKYLPITYAYPNAWLETDQQPTRKGTTISVSSFRLQATVTNEESQHINSDPSKDMERNRKGRQVRSPTLGHLMIFLYESEHSSKFLDILWPVRRSKWRLDP